MKKVLALLLGSILLLSLSSFGFAEDAPQPAPAKKAAKTVKAAKGPVEVKPDAAKDAPAKGAAKGTAKKAKGKPVDAKPGKDVAKEQEVVLASFETFAKDWIAKSNRNFQASSAKKQIVQNGSGWLARYQEIDGSTMELDIQRTGIAAAPYTGTLKYLENTWECSGKDQAEASGGQFACAKTVKITEIFRYQNNVWKY